MKLKMFSVAVLFLFAVVPLAQADTFSYPADDPQFSITFPDDWTVEPDEQLLHAGPKDGTIYLGVWALEGAENLDTALEALDEALGKFFTELELGEADTMEVNDIPFVAVDGTGADKDGDKVDLSVALFLPDENSVYILLYFGTEEAEETHEDELMSIIQSIKAE
jgi:hypothetical protein